ncbi:MULTISPECIES: AMP-binding enzyme [Micrococcus]
MKGYYRNPEATAATLVDGWLRTGDMGYRDEDGFIYVVDRKKELILRGGYNVYPREVEEVIATHPAVSEVAVVGRPHPSLGSEVVAVVSTRPGMSVTPAGVIEHAKVSLAAYKYPREVVVVDSLPKTATGKIRKRDLATTLAEPASPESHSATP